MNIAQFYAEIASPPGQISGYVLAWSGAILLLIALSLSIITVTLNLADRLDSIGAPLAVALTCAIAGIGLAEASPAGSFAQIAAPGSRTLLLRHECQAFDRAAVGGHVQVEPSGKMTQANAMTRTIDIRCSKAGVPPADLMRGWAALVAAQAISADPVWVPGDREAQ